MTHHPLGRAAPLAGPPRAHRRPPRSGVLLLHGFTGSPASMTPWARVPRRAGVRRGGAAAARPRHPLAGPEHGSPGPTGTPRPSARSTGCARAPTRSWSAASRWAASLALRLAEERGRRRGRPGAGQPVRRPAPARSCRLLPVLKHLVPSLKGVVNDIKKPGAGRGRLPPDSRCAALHAIVRRCGRSLVAGPAEGHRSRCSTSAPPWTTSIDASSSADRARARSARARRRASGSSTDSYHVATLDNDAAADLRGERRVHRPGDRVLTRA